MRWNHHIFLGMLFGSILGVFYAAELAGFLPLLVIGGVAYMLSFVIKTDK